MKLANDYIRVKPESAMIGKVVELGPDCKPSTMMGDMGTVLKLGDLVVYQNAQEFTINGDKYMLVSEKYIMAVL